MEMIAFVVLAGLAIISALTVVTHRNQVVAALALVGNLVAIAGFYLLLNAQFLALLQVIVYAGAIMVLVLFVIMLLNLPDEISTGRRAGLVQGGLGVLLALTFVILLGGALREFVGSGTFPIPSAEFGTVSSVGNEIFTTFFYAFEAISLLLVVAMIGAVLLAKRRL